MVQGNFLAIQSEVGGMGGGEGLVAMGEVMKKV